MLASTAVSEIEEKETGEEIAAASLMKKGYRINNTNFHCPVGKIDIVAYKNKTIVFIEVKKRKSDKLGYLE
jgi:putative endonuclease